MVQNRCFTSSVLLARPSNLCWPSLLIPDPIFTLFSAHLLCKCVQSLPKRRILVQDIPSETIPQFSLYFATLTFYGPEGEAGPSSMRTCLCMLNMTFLCSSKCHIIGEDGSNSLGPIWSISSDVSIMRSLQSGALKWLRVKAAPCGLLMWLFGN